jgi:hypothetical protein
MAGGRKIEHNGGTAMRNAIKTLEAVSLLLLFGAQQWAAAPARQMVVTVTNKHFEPAQPVANIRVTLSYFDGSEKITDARERTNRQGQTELRVSAEAEERGDLRIEVADAAGLVVYKPSEGLVTAVTAVLTVELLPKGSPALLEPAQIEAMLNRLSRLSIQNQRLKVSLSKAESQKPDFDQALRDWAAGNGLPYEEVNERVHRWADEVLAHREEASLSKQAEAELGLRHFERAAILFQGAANVSKQALHKEQESYLARRRDELRALLKESEQSAAAYQLAHQYGKATDALDDACKEAAAEHQHYPNDGALRDIWLWGSLFAEGVRWKEGENALAQESLPKNSVQLFARVTENCQNLLKQMDASVEPDKWAYTESFLAVAFVYRSELSSSGQAAEFRTQAIAATRAALEVYNANKEKDPKAWAYFETFYGLTLAVQAARSITDGRIAMDQAADMLEQSAAAFRACLEVYDKAGDRQDWGWTQTVLGELMIAQSLLAKGPRATEFLARAEAADRAALDVFSKTEHPDDWASTEGALGSVLSSQADAASGGEADGLYAKAAAAFHAALEAHDPKEEPAKWADTQHSLGDLLQNQGMRATGSRAAELIAQAAAAFRAELEVITRARFPQRWARIESNLGDALATEAVRVTRGQSAELCTQAAAAYDAALEVFTREYPLRWARTQGRLAGVLVFEGVRSTGSESVELLDKGIAGYRAALEVLTKEGEAQEWATTQSSLGSALGAEAGRVDGARSNNLLAQAAVAFRAVLEAVTREANPKEWQDAQSNLAQVLTIQGVRASGTRAAGLFAEAAAAYIAALEADPKNAGILSGLSTLYHEYLTDFAKAHELTVRLEAADPTDGNRLNLAEADLTTSRFSDCLDLVGATNAAQLEGGNVPARQALECACQWGAGQHKLAAQSADLLATLAGTISKGGWTTAGDRKYLATAPEFAAGRALWIQLFQSVEDGNGASMAEAAHGLHGIMGN